MRKTTSFFGTRKQTWKHCGGYSHSRSRSKHRSRSRATNFYPHEPAELFPPASAPSRGGSPMRAMVSPERKRTLVRPTGGYAEMRRLGGTPASTSIVDTGKGNNKSSNRAEANAVAKTPSDGGSKSTQTKQRPSHDARTQPSRSRMLSPERSVSLSPPRDGRQLRPTPVSRFSRPIRGGQDHSHVQAGERMSSKDYTKSKHKQERAEPTGGWLKKRDWCELVENCKNLKASSDDPKRKRKASEA